MRFMWLGWAGVCLALLLLWGAATRSGLKVLLYTRSARVEDGLVALKGKFLALQQLPRSVLASRPADLEAVRAQVQPYFEAYRGAMPPWIGALLAGQTSPAGVFDLRPQPPGMQAGRRYEPDPPDLPPSYWLIGQPDGLVLSLNVHYVFGPWLRHQLDLIGLASDVRARHLDPLASWGPPTPASADWLRPGWRVATFFPQERVPFDMVEVKLDNSSAVLSYLATQALCLAAGGLTMALFALAGPRLSRRWPSEWEFIEARQRFNTLVSHELRTPIAAIQMNAEILQKPWVDDGERVKVCHQVIGQAAARLAHVVENLLGLGRHESGRVQFERAPLDVNAVISELLARQAGIWIFSSSLICRQPWEIGRLWD